MEIEIVVILFSGLLLLITAVLGRSLSGKWKITAWVAFCVVLLFYMYSGIRSEIKHKVEKEKDSAKISTLTDTNKEILQINQELLKIVKSPSFAKDPATTDKIGKIETALTNVNTKLNLPPVRVILKGTFWPPSPEGNLINKVTVPVENGIVTVAFTLKNVSTIHANNGSIWIQVHNDCRFADDPQGLKTLQKVGNFVVKGVPFVRIDSGVYLQPILLKIIPPTGIDSFIITFAYACDTCPPADKDNEERFTVFVKR
jgi:hypothetical protein